MRTFSLEVPAKTLKSDEALKTVCPTFQRFSGSNIKQRLNNPGADPDYFLRLAISAAHPLKRAIILAGSGVSVFGALPDGTATLPSIIKVPPLVNES